MSNSSNSYENNKNCFDCDKSISSQYKRCYDCNVKRPDNKKLSDKCVDCDKLIKNGFKRCFSCNMERNEHSVKCDVCNKGKVTPPHLTCFDCAFNICSKCGKKNAKKPNKMCYKCFIHDGDLNNFSEYSEDN